MNFFSDLCISTSFPLCYNLLPHFAAQGENFAALTKCITATMEDGRIQTFLLSDSPADLLNFTPLDLAEEVIGAGGDPIIVLALNYYDRNGVMDKLHEYYRAGVRQFLFVSGNYPFKGSTLQQKPVFDIDSVQMLMLLAEASVNGDIVKGCVASPFKAFESEQVWQYEKLKRKISVGADFIVSQLGFDVRKSDELVQFCRLHDITAPLVANVCLIDRQVAKLIQDRTIPGVTIPGDLLRTLHDEAFASDATLARTAKFLAVVKGLGYQGALIGASSPDFSQTKQLLDISEDIQGEWQDLVHELQYSAETAPRFYYFKKDMQNGLNTKEPAPIALKHFPSLTYSFSFFVDWLIYVPQGPLFTIAGRFCRFSDHNRFCYFFLWLLEFISKKMLYGCNMCGDCTLYACGFLCYRSGCPKKIVNGPCGGSIAGYCEVFPEKKRCFWVKVYHNMKGVRQHVTFVAPPIPPRERTLDRTSSWINFFVGKDHRQMKIKNDQS